jgi:hypothetical protein
MQNRIKFPVGGIAYTTAARLALLDTASVPPSICIFVRILTGYFMMHRISENLRLLNLCGVLRALLLLFELKNEKLSKNSIYFFWNYRTLHDILR